MRGRSTRLLGWRLIASAAEEYRSDFGASLKPPPVVTSFRYKSSGKPRPKKNQKPPPRPKESAHRLRPSRRRTEELPVFRSGWLRRSRNWTRPKRAAVHEEPRRQDLRDRRRDSPVFTSIVRGALFLIMTLSFAISSAINRSPGPPPKPQTSRAAARGADARVTAAAAAPESVAWRNLRLHLGLIDV